ncbi:MAG: amino acid adenylation domain-containing protein [Pelatocladus maniniholoensis HA4357-MV3]|jgi:amino acid adenylation domain-containing protein|uniref:Amino acid adenylation domain-containing protein n=1 Tax=Pelatocladus maniniholoensis HA4357-MV3 TaxID=1117104 RepID=A0A9E3H8B8_9NOST|nr:amino acid adenylation domain-containing protein [Pelatocladus maniniholoensis HA4357-MV3]
MMTKILDVEELFSQKIYWLNQLSGELPETNLIQYYARTSQYIGKNKSHYFELPDYLSQGIIKLTKGSDFLLYLMLVSAFKILMQRYLGTNDLIVGIPAYKKINGVNLDYLNDSKLIPLRTQLCNEMTFKNFLIRVKDNLIQAYSHQDYCFDELIDLLNLPQVENRCSLFDTVILLENIHNKNDVLKFKNNITVSFLAENNEICGSIDYNENNFSNKNLQLVTNFYTNIVQRTDSFAESYIQKMVGHLQTLLQAIVANPQQRLLDLPLLTEYEKYQLLREWNNTEVEYPQQQCIHELFAAQVEEVPDAIAVVFENQQLSYRELNRRANQLAHYLRSAKLSRSDSLGVKPEILVGICVERSLSMVIGLLAILKAGGAYVPLDPSYPQERLAYMLEDSQAGVLLTQQYLLENISNHKAQVICIDSDWEKIAHESTDNPISNITLDNLAYVIYTSGSTGKPKGAMNAHSGILNRLLWMQQTYQLTSADAVLQKTPFSFDVSVWEFFWTLITGARLVVAQPEGHKDTNYLVNLIAQQQITTLHFVPSMLQVFIEAESLEKCQSLVRVITSGEALSVQLQQRFFNRLNAQLHNLYGPTEAAVDVTFWQCEKDNITNQNTVPIGQPIANIQIYLLDKYLNLVPVGITGEVYIGGVAVGRGYLNRPDLTAEKFIPNPFSQQTERLYKTGDKARYLANGEIEYISRIDHQVKVRGLRIELGEIEVIISQYPAVRETVVIVNGESADSQRIVAYVVPQKEQTLKITELRSFLESKLPNYMVPAAFVTLEALPLTPNGKVDRKALPAPDTVRPELEVVYQPPQTEIEKTIADIWQEVLHVENVGIHDNFFELGGHSLLLVQVHSKLQKIFQKNLLLVEMFQHPTVSHLARYFSQESTEETYFVSHRSQSTKDSTQRRKQARKEHRAAAKERGVSS